MRTVPVLLIAFTLLGCSQRTKFIEDHTTDGKFLVNCDMSELSDTSLHYECKFSERVYEGGADPETKKAIGKFLKSKCSEIKDAGFKSILVEGKFDTPRKEFLTVDAKRLEAGDCTLKSEL